MKKSKRIVLGFVLIILGLVFNKFILEKISPDQKIENIFYVMDIFIFQLILIFLGIHLLSSKKIWKVISIFLFTVFLFLSGFNAHHFLENRRGKNFFISNVSQDSGQSLDQILLNEALFLEHKKNAQLADETREILYSLHKNSNEIKVRIPKDGILDTALGIHRDILKMYKGQVQFEILSSRSGKDFQSLFRKAFDLSEKQGKDFHWHTVHIDMKPFAGKDLTLLFKKTFKTGNDKELKAVYDLLPTDFMFWQIPQIRPQKIPGNYNIVLVSMDTVRSDHLHFMGYQRDTSPFLDKFVQKGTYFTKVVSQAPWTTPSHFSIFTSTYPSIHSGDQPIQETSRHWNSFLPTLFSILRGKGYFTAAFTGVGSISAKFGFYKGFDFYNETAVDRKTRADAKPIFNKAEQWISENKERTFCLFIQTYEVHHPYVDNHFVDLENIRKSDVIGFRTARYDGDIRRADFFLGRFLQKFKEWGLLEKTIIVILSDHGEDLGGRNPPESVLQFGHGYNLYDELLLVPLVFVNPDLIPAGKRIDFQIRLIDVLPTLLDYMGIDQEKTFQGKSLKRMIEGTDRLDRPAYSEATTHGPERESLRYDGFKYIRRLSYGQLTEPTSRGYPLTPLHELYDLESDPHERNNLAKNKPDLVKKYQKLISDIIPDKTRLDRNRSRSSESINIAKDKKLIETLKSLGYIK